MEANAFIIEGKFFFLNSPFPFSTSFFLIATFFLPRSSVLFLLFVFHILSSCFSLLAPPSHSTTHTPYCAHKHTQLEIPLFLLPQPVPSTNPIPHHYHHDATTLGCTFNHKVRHIRRAIPRNTLPRHTTPHHFTSQHMTPYDTTTCNSHSPAIRSQM